MSPSHANAGSQRKQGSSPSTVFVAAPTISARSAARRRNVSRDFLRDAFRPFYLGGALFAAAAVPLWLGMWYHGYFTPSLPPLLWHAHEMVFGFAAAIIVGFLFTAARNWTGLPLPSGVPLALIFALWLAGRAGMLFAYGAATAAVDSLLLVVVAGVLARRFILARSLGNMPLVIVLGLLAAANVAFHASMLDLVALAPLTPLEAGLMLVVLMEMIVGGRIVPGFTANALPGVRQWRPAWLHRAALALVTAALASDLLNAPPVVTGTLALVAGVAVAVKSSGWRPLATLGNPMLWVLHLSYAWIAVGLVLLGLASFGVVPRSAGVHALAVGSMGGLILGMITRTALGHSGRTVRAGRVEVAAFALVHLSAAWRVAAALIPDVNLAGLLVAGVLWSAAFMAYSIAYAPMLLGLSRAKSAAPRR